MAFVPLITTLAVSSTVSLSPYLLTTSPFLIIAEVHGFVTSLLVVFSFAFEIAATLEVTLL